MASPNTQIRKVAVIGAGLSGVVAAIHLKHAGLDVSVFERSARAGGIWVYDERTAKDAAYPSTLPSVGESPEFDSLSMQRGGRQDSPLHDSKQSKVESAHDEDIRLAFAPPGPCYVALRNNVSTIEMEISCQTWPNGTDEFVPHHVLGDYIQAAAQNNGVLDSTTFNTRVNHVQKEDTRWRVDTARLSDGESGVIVDESSGLFDAVVVASGHYHACNVPDIPGLSAWKDRFPDRVFHSKLYRRPEQFKDQNILIVGAGVSSTDIARDLGPYARSIYQSSRGGAYDLPSHLLPTNAARICGIERFEGPSSSNGEAGNAIPGAVLLRSGEKLCNIDNVILATGYHVSLPFMREYHADSVRSADADERVLVTDGQQHHNLHKDIWYIEDPTLAFIGVPYHTATFTAFEFQAQALAAVFSGKVALPDRSVMRQEYVERILRKGAGRTFHSLKARGDEIAYVQELVALVNSSDPGRMQGHSQKWLDAYARRTERQKSLFSQVRDASLDAKVMGLAAGCT